ncbi:FkbM family methyltransferase [Plastoroseomonas arctica]|uniref:FkbM family methyltransferase n=1 Tax=Plastoroseomonas arctica TaxID=1509237 RepID=A0AAF1JVA0_9PROT|nr:FkbM family methyltransferase [Plastoroseomonas arctica]MBR0654051.1 FkbM family methyltransferase [Plastoroseomonas arctica]
MDVLHMDHDTAATIEALRHDVARLAARLEDVAGVVTAGYHENLFWLRRIHNSSAIYLGGHVALTHLSNGCRAYIDTRSKDVGVHILQTGTWETPYTEAFKSLLRPGARVVDVGANLGWYALVAAPIVGREGRVYAVEPNPELARMVYWSLRTNGFGAFSKVFDVAVGDVPDVVDLVSRPDMPGGGYIRPTVHAVEDPAPSTTRVASVPLDTLLAEEAAPIDVLKMDVEGWEGMALRGMRATMDRSPGLRMLIEWSTQQDGSPAPRREMAETLEGRGYTPHRIDGQGKLIRAEWGALLEETALINLVLLPAGDAMLEG